ncbi:transposase domain-containing protein, partial [Pseudomonas sp.]|uniref:transposase domain-containing protein n=1 Tax=Pseudomonas sp. TaxID=306 RepID=UPI003566E604
MSIAQDLSDVLDAAGQPLTRLDTLAQHIPQEWVEAAALLAEQATIRQRRLPADMVLWLVVGMALFRSEPITEVARRLNICAEGLANDVLLAK